MSAAAKKKRNARDPEEALPLQMLDCSRDRGERKFETHREEVDHAVHATVSGDRSDLQLSTFSMTTTNVGAHWSRGFSPFCTQAKAIFL